MEEYIVNDIDYTVVDSAANSIKLLAEAMHIYSDSNTDSGTINSFIRFLNAFSGQKFDETGDIFDWSKFEISFEGLAEAANSGIEEAASEINADAIVDKIVNSITSGEERIKDAISSAITVSANNATPTVASEMEEATESIEDTTKQTEATIGGVFGILSMLSDGLNESGEELGTSVGDALSGIKDTTEEIVGDLGDSLGVNNITGLVLGDNSTEVMAQKGNDDGSSYIDGFLGQVVSKVFGVDISPTVSPVVDDSGFSGFNLSNGLVNLTGAVTIDSSQIATISSVITTQTNRAITAIQDVSNRVENLEQAILGMSIVLDTGVIAGAVDNRLGSASGFGQRTRMSAGGH